MSVQFTFHEAHPGDSFIHSIAFVVHLGSGFLSPAFPPQGHRQSPIGPIRQRFHPPKSILGLQPPPPPPPGPLPPASPPAPPASPTRHVRVPLVSIWTVFSRDKAVGPDGKACAAGRAEQVLKNLLPTVSPGHPLR